MLFLHDILGTVVVQSSIEWKEGANEKSQLCEGGHITERQKYDESELMIRCIREDCLLSTPQLRRATILRTDQKMAP